MMTSTVVGRIRIGNVKHGDCGEYVGRGSYGKTASPLGNPFVVGRDGARGECVKKYEQWLPEQIARGNAAVINELKRLVAILRKNGTLTLVCWCAPHACHAEPVAKAVMALYERTET